MLYITQRYEYKKMKWWHCLIIYVVANGISLIPAGFNGDEAFYNNFEQPGLAPPDWMFAPVWFINNVTSLIGLYTIVNLPADTHRRSSVIWAEGISWVLYATFAILYFGMKSPVLGAVNTAIGLLLTILSVAWSYRISRKAAWMFAPRLAWLLLATYVSAWIALKNRDIFLEIGPFID